MKAVFSLLKETFDEWREDNASRLAAALSYYMIFSLPPLLLIIIAIAGYFLGRGNVQEDILAQIEDLVGPEGQNAVRTMLEQASNPTSGIIATIVGVATLLMGAAGVFGQLHSALNTIWEVAPAPGGGILNTVKQRVFSFTVVLGTGFLLLVSLVISAAISGLAEYAADFLPASGLVLQLVNVVLSFAFTTLLFALMFKILPDARINWSDVWVGAAVTALLFTVGKFLIGLYLGRSSTASAYGAAGSLVLLLVWIYYSAQILFFGAEFTQVYARRYGKRIEPEEGAIRVDVQRARPHVPAVQEKLADAHARPPLPATRPPRAEREGNRLTRLPKSPNALLYGLGLVGFAVGMLLGGVAASGAKNTKPSEEPDKYN